MHPYLLYSFLALYLVGFCFFTYYCIFADPAEDKTAFYVSITVPDKISAFARSLLGAKNADILSTLLDYSLIIIYLVLVLGSWSIIFFYAYPWVDRSSYVSDYHKIIGYLVFGVCMTSWRFASSSSPGIITSRTLAKYDNYPYDELLFVSGRICPTVGIPKLARSKFDRHSGVHIAKFDHFCGWLHNPIGEENYRWFLMFLVVHVCMCSYGTAICYLLFLGEVNEHNLWNVTFYNVQTGEELQSDWFMIFNFMMQRHGVVGSVMALMAVMALTLGAFLGWHIWVASRGLTTNETVKWDQIRKFHKKEMKRYKEAVKNGTAAARQEEASKLLVTDLADGDVTCSGGAPSKAATPDNAKQDESNADDEVVYDPGPMPENLYNLGFVENWKDIIWPRSLRPEALERYRTTPPYTPKTRSGPQRETNKTK